MSSVRRLPFLDVAGSAFERGEQLGRHLRERIRAFLSQDLARINRVRPQALRYEDALRYIGCCAAIIEAELPEIACEVRGLAIGAGISYGDAMLLQCRRELITFEEGDCTTLAGFNDAGAFIAQNVDLPGELEDLALIVRALGRTGTRGELQNLGLLQIPRL